ncbi:hypothetical protein Tco_0697412 [Tanacetum coccineum]
MIAFLEKPTKSNGFQEIIDFLNANQIHYALTVNPTIYTSCIEQFWATAKAKMVNGERGIDCLPTTTIFEELARMGVTPLFETMMVQANQEEGVDLCIPTDSQQTTYLNTQSIIHLKPQKENNPRRRTRKETEMQSKLGRFFEDIDKDAEVSLVDEKLWGGYDQNVYTDDLHDSVAPTIPVTTAGEGVTATKIDEITTTSAPTTTIDEITLAQTLIEIKAAKPKAVTTAATTTTTTRPKARGVVVQEPSEFRTTTSSPQASQPSKTKDKGKAIMIEPEVPLKKKDQVALDEEMARNLEAQLQAELIEEERLARKKEEEANIALIESWENTQAMMEADRLLAERLQTREQEELTDEEKAKLFMEFMEKRRKHFAALRAQEKRKRPPTKTQKRNQMSIYLKHMGGYKHNQLKDRSYDEIQKLFNKEMKRVNSFVAMNSEAQEISEKKDESSSKKAKIVQDSSAKRAGDKLESNKSKKQKTDENEEVEVDNEAELKKHMVTFKDDDIAIDAIPLATKPPMIGIDREDLQNLWKLVKTKHGDTRPEDEHDRVLWVRFGNVHIFMLVEKRYPLTPTTITNMLNKKLQADYWNEKCYQLLKLMVKQQKGQ